MRAHVQHLYAMEQLNGCPKAVVAGRNAGRSCRRKNVTGDTLSSPAAQIQSIGREELMRQALLPDSGTATNC